HEMNTSCRSRLNCFSSSPMTLEILRASLNSFEISAFLLAQMSCNVLFLETVLTNLECSLQYAPLSSFVDRSALTKTRPVKDTTRLVTVVVVWRNGVQVGGRCSKLLK